MVAAYSPRVRPGVPVSFPVEWDELDAVTPGDFTIRSAPDALDARPDCWAAQMPAPQTIPPACSSRRARRSPCHAWPAMHEGKRRAREPSRRR